MRNATFVSGAKRFPFGKNWRAFLEVIDDERMSRAEESLTAMLGAEGVAGRSFLDIGCGSGLFSLAAMRLGASRVHSLDYDQESVDCAEELRRRYFPADTRWVIERGDVLDEAAMRRLGQWDVVYAWGVLHATGNLWRAIEHSLLPLQAGGLFFVGLYHDQGWRSRWWLRVKRLYNTNAVGRAVTVATFFPYFVLLGLQHDLRHLKNPLRRFSEYKQQRGMSVVHDWRDWLGGYPYEVSTPDQVFDFCHTRGLNLEKIKLQSGGFGFNQFVFRKQDAALVGAG